MARVVLPQALTVRAGGQSEHEVEGRNVRGLGQELEGRVAVAIDGEIFNDPMLEAVGPDSEVHFLPRVGGG